MKEKAMKSHYSDPPKRQAIRRHTLSVLVDNEPGVLARIAGLFSGRGYNIESLTVSETEHQKHVSRITVVTAGSAQVIEQIIHQLERLVPVHRVIDLTTHGEAVEREVALVKVAGKGENRAEALRLASAFGAKTLDATMTSFIFELTGTSEEIDRFLSILAEIGLVEVSRTGVAAMGRGPDAF